MKKNNNKQVKIDSKKSKDKKPESFFKRFLGISIMFFVTKFILDFITNPLL